MVEAPLQVSRGLCLQRCLLQLCSVHSGCSGLPVSETHGFVSGRPLVLLVGKNENTYQSSYLGYFCNIVTMVALRILCHLSAKTVILPQHLLFLFLTLQSRFFCVRELGPDQVMGLAFLALPGVRITKYGGGYWDPTQGEAAPPRKVGIVT